MVEPTSSSFITWLNEYAPYIQFFAQVFFWIVVSLCAILATVIFNRFVKHQTKGERGSAIDASAAPAPVENASKSDINVDGFID